ncbi:MAG: nuclease-related domain-containing protein, partial [Acetobacteraceae bacterium]
ARVGEAGERLVASELTALGWPALLNVILAGPRGRTVEFDHLVRVPDRTVMLETKTYSSFIAGGPDTPRWTQHRADGDLVPRSGDPEPEPCPRFGTVRQRRRGASSRVFGVGWPRAL